MAAVGPSGKASCCSSPPCWARSRSGARAPVARAASASARRTSRRRPTRRAPPARPGRRGRAERDRRSPGTGRHAPAPRRSPWHRPPRPTTRTRPDAHGLSLEHALRGAHVDVRRPHLHPAPLRVPHQARGRIEAHRLRVQQRSEELGRIVMTQPGRLVGEQAKRQPHVTWGSRSPRNRRACRRSRPPSPSGTPLCVAPSMKRAR